jgi:hypothetical protein
MMFFRTQAMAAAFAIFACTASAQSVPSNSAPAHSWSVIGVVHRDIADSSPIAKLTFSTPDSPFTVGMDVNVHYVFVNESGHRIRIKGPLFEVEVRDSAGNLPPETDLGCRRHFFSPCHTNRPYFASQAVFTDDPDQKMQGDEDLRFYYDLTKPGVYTAIGYVCSVLEGPPCFKTNTVKFTIQ